MSTYVRTGGVLRRAPLVLGAAVLGLWASTGVAQAAFPGANGKIAFASSRDGDGTSEIYVMDADGSGQTRLTQDPAHDGDPTWSPDGSRIAFFRVFHSKTRLYVMNADGSGQTRLTDEPGHDSQPAWSPDGSKIAFTSFRGFEEEIYVMNADGSGQTRLTDSANWNRDPAWSPEGDKIAFSSYRDGNYEIYVMNPDGSGQTRLTEHPGPDRRPAWSPDGSTIAFDSNRDEGNVSCRAHDFNCQIYVMNADGSGQTKLTEAPGVDPAWSPDGNKITFVSGFQVHVMDADGSGPINLTPHPDAGDHPDWQPLPDEDGDGIPDDEDVEGIQAAIDQLPASTFKGGDGHRTAMHNILDAVERAVAAGDIAKAIEKLQSLRRRVDGCGLLADLDDWIVDCAAQVDIRQQIDTLITNLSS